MNNRILITLALLIEASCTSPIPANAAYTLPSGTTLQDNLNANSNGIDNVGNIDVDEDATVDGRDLSVDGATLDILDALLTWSQSIKTTDASSTLTPAIDERYLTITYGDLTIILDEVGGLSFSNSSAITSHVFDFDTFRYTIDAKDYIDFDVVDSVNTDKFSEVYINERYARIGSTGRVWIDANTSGTEVGYIDIDSDGAIDIGAVGDIDFETEGDIILEGTIIELDSNDIKLLDPNGGTSLTSITTEGYDLMTEDTAGQITALGLDNVAYRDEAQEWTADQYMDNAGVDWHFGAIDGYGSIGTTISGTGDISTARPATFQGGLTTDNFLVDGVFSVTESSGVINIYGEPNIEGNEDLWRTELGLPLSVTGQSDSLLLTSDSSTVSDATLIVERTFPTTTIGQPIALLIRNPGDDSSGAGTDRSGEVHIAMQSTGTVTDRRYISGLDHNGAVTNIVGFNAANRSIIYDGESDVHQLYGVPSSGGGGTYINSIDGGKVMINALTSDARRGTGGLEVNAGSSHTLVFDADGNNIKCLKPTLINTSTTDADAILVIRESGTDDGLALKAISGPSIFFDTGSDGTETNRAVMKLNDHGTFVFREWYGSGSDKLFKIESGGNRDTDGAEVFSIDHDGQINSNGFLGPNLIDDGNFETGDASTNFGGKWSVVSGATILEVADDGGGGVQCVTVWDASAGRYLIYNHGSAIVSEDTYCMLIFRCKNTEAIGSSWFVRAYDPTDSESGDLYQPKVYVKDDGDWHTVRMLLQLDNEDERLFIYFQSDDPGEMLLDNISLHKINIFDPGTITY